MDKIIRIDDYRARTLADKAFGRWTQRFGRRFAADTGLRDLDDRILYALAQPGDASTEAFYELIMGTLALGAPAGFPYLANDERMRVIEVHLFLADLVRFELMRRLGWLAPPAGGELSLVETVLRHEALAASLRADPPRLNAAHPAHDEYAALAAGDRQVFIRRLLPAALETFREQVEKKPN